MKRLTKSKFKSKLKKLQKRAKKLKIKIMYKKNKKFFYKSYKRLLKEVKGFKKCKCKKCKCKKCKCKRQSFRKRKNKFGAFDWNQDWKVKHPAYSAVHRRWEEMNADEKKAEWIAYLAETEAYKNLKIPLDDTGEPEYGLYASETSAGNADNEAYKRVGIDYWGIDIKPTYNNIARPIRGSGPNWDHRLNQRDEFERILDYYIRKYTSESRGEEFDEPEPIGRGHLWKNQTSWLGLTRPGPSRMAGVTMLPPPWVNQGDLFQQRPTRQNATRKEIMEVAQHFPSAAAFRGQFISKNKRLSPALIESLFAKKITSPDGRTGYVFTS